MTPIIEVKNLSKQYQIGQRQRYLSLRDALVDTFKFRQSNSKAIETDFWALNDISFDVQAGESIGIIGRNGAGKSTLLKILSRITPPTKGKAILRGRMASLLEVGTGFHPELTGRENVYFNASILGLRKAEVVQKFDEIVAFSGVEQFIDTPLKHYSSGMQLRLAFAVAAHLEPEILVIDEVLAVGDAEFQKKCLGKMDEVSKSGRTVIFVSHSMGLIQQLCERSILLDKGQMIDIGQTSKVIQNYLQADRQNNTIDTQSDVLKDIFLQSIQSINSENFFVHTFLINESPIFKVVLGINRLSEGAVIGLVLLDKLKRKLFTVERRLSDLVHDNATQCRFVLKIPPRFLMPSNYSWYVSIHVPNLQNIFSADDICSFSITDTGSEFTKYGDIDNGNIFAPVEIEVLS